jgi:TetR/AcrR family transcriptional repressor of mexJK operon
MSQTAVDEQKTGSRVIAIVQAAQKRFAYYGYSKTTMDEIAHDLGMGKASLYYYFPTKESLFGAVIKSEQDEFIAHAKTLIAGPGTAAEKIFAYIDRRLDYFQRTVILSKFSMETYSQIRPAFAHITEDFARHERRFLCELLESGIRNGEFAVNDLEWVAGILLRVLQGLRVLLFKAGAGGEPGAGEFERLRQESNTATQIFLRGIRPETGNCPTPPTQRKPD